MSSSPIEQLRNRAEKMALYAGLLAAVGHYRAARLWATKADEQWTQWCAAVEADRQARASRERFRLVQAGD